MVKKCEKCGKVESEFLEVSRLDNKTKICPQCDFKESMEEEVNCCVCNKECVPDPDCKDNWLCPDKNCSVHKEE